MGFTYTNTLGSLTIIIIYYDKFINKHIGVIAAFKQSPSHTFWPRQLCSQYTY